MRGVLLSPPQGRGFRETRGELLFVASGQEAMLGLPQMFSQLAQQFDTVRPISIFQPGSWDLGESLLPSCTGMRDDSQTGPHSVHMGWVGGGRPSCWRKPEPVAFLQPLGGDHQGSVPKCGRARQEEPGRKSGPRWNSDEPGLVA